jgi:DNA-directed RNA polymerase alpha subunit
LCCGEISVEGKKQKYCADMMYDVEYEIMWTANEETGGKLVKSLEIYTKDGQRCSKALTWKEMS